MIRILLAIALLATFTPATAHAQYGPRTFRTFTLTGLSDEYRVYTWHSGLQRATEGDNDTTTLRVRMFEYCWQVVVIDGERRQEWLDPACDGLTPDAGVYRADGAYHIQWRAPREYPTGCFIRERGNVPLGCTPEMVYTPAGLVSGDSIEVRAYNAEGEYITTTVAVP